MIRRLLAACALALTVAAPVSAKEHVSSVRTTRARRVAR